MPVQHAVKVLEQRVDDCGILHAVCERWKALSYGPGRRQAAAAAGALPAIVKALSVHVEDASAASICCLATGNIVAGVDEQGIARKASAAEAGALRAIVNAMQAHVHEADVQAHGSFALGNITYAADGAGLARKQMAADACAVTAIVQGMKANSADAAVQEYGCFALGNIVRAVGGAESGTDTLGKQRKTAAVDAGALEVIVVAMRFHSAESGVQEWGARALSNITYGCSEWRDRAKAAGARPQWLVGMAEAMQQIEATKANGAGASKTERLAIRAPQPRTANTARGAVGSSQHAAPVAPSSSSRGTGAHGGRAKRQPRIPPKQDAAGLGGAGKMVPLPDAGPLWR